MIIYDEENRIFTIDGQRVPSVTEIIPKPDFSFVKPDVMANAIREGVAMHKQIEDYFLTGDTLEDDNIIELDIFLKSQHELIGDFVCSEKRFCHKGYNPFVGKPDAVFTKAIIDFKRTPPDKSMSALQFSGYQKLLNYNGDIINEFGNWLLCYKTKTGWRFKNVYNDYASIIFSKCLENYWNNIEVEKYLARKGKNYA